jgi:hypothetical protein
MAIDLTSSAASAAVAYQDALNQARNTQNALLRQYGFTAPGVGGEYSVEGAQAAFDPNTLFDKATGGINQARLQELTSSLRTGSTGLLSDITRGGATAEAEAIMGARAAGIGRGGLAAQRRALAEAQTAGQLGEARGQFLAGLGEAMSPIGGAFQQLQIAEAQAKAQEEAAKAAASTIPQTAEEAAMAAEAGDMMQTAGGATSVMPNKPNTKGGILGSGSRGNYKVKTQPKGNVPKNPKPGQTFQGKGGVTAVFRPQGPSGAGWYKKKK